ncbi:DNA-binding protein [Actinomadura sp. NPDC048955]|uniref:DNA-binding protein n=1 Tax=Actinomadura sp. NPDC048955 TaxID=3158228 RepID=UPI0033F845AB
MGTEPVASLTKLAAPARRALAAAGYGSLTQLARAREDDIVALHGMGPNAMKTLRQALQEHGLSFRASNDA